MHAFFLFYTFINVWSSSASCIWAILIKDVGLTQFLLSDYNWNMHIEALHQIPYILPLLLLLMLFWSCYTPSLLCFHWLAGVLQGVGPAAGMSDDQDPSSGGWQDTQVFAWTHTNTPSHTHSNISSVLNLHLQLYNLSPAGAIMVIIITIMTIMSNVKLTTICSRLSTLHYWCGKSVYLFSGFS